MLALLEDLFAYCLWTSTLFEDLDFWTLQPFSDFVWQPYLYAVQEEFKAYAFDMIIEDGSKAETKIKRAFLKKNGLGKC